MADAYPAHAVALVGLAGRFPGAANLEAFWRNIRGGVESLDSLSTADLEAVGIDRRTSSDPAYVRKSTALEGADLFDAAFFGMSPREAQILDPQQRVFLECAWEALEHAGHVPGQGPLAVGVYAGAGMNTYLITQVMRNPELMAAVGGYQLMLGNDKDFLCTRVSYKLDLHGPSVTVQTACSTSLVAVVMACRALERGECDVALAGGVSIPAPQRTGYRYEEGMILSPDGHCRPFDVNAAGTRPSAGCGVVVLKRLSDARADGDTIHAIILGAAINNDGAGKAGYTAPSIDGQVEVIATAQTLAGVTPRSVGYIEAHGTGTPLGDPIEIAALTQVFRASTADTGFCRLGSLKANLGHLDAAAGVAGLIKAVLVLKHREFPPLVNFTAANPRLELDSSPFIASATSASWESRDTARLAGVSSFGIGGTNAHVVLAEGPLDTTSPVPRDAHLLILSAKTATALEAKSQGLRDYLVAHPDARLGDVEFTLQLGRRAFAHRRAVIARTVTEAAEALSPAHQQPAFVSIHEGGARSVAFLFSGQGSQFAGMGARLYDTESVYRDAVDRCARLLEPSLNEDLRGVMLETAAGTRINATRLAQPALFVTEYALAQLWQSWGVVPVAMLGHSIGELVAAHLAGVMSLEDALTVVAARGRLMQSLPAGSMAAVHMHAAALVSRLPPGVEIAAINAPGMCTISGTTDAVAAALQSLQAGGVETRALHTSHAFHSSMMDPALGPFTRVLEGITLSAPRIPYISNVTGNWITAKQAQSPAYYAAHLRGAVSFEAGVRALAADAQSMMLEVGPGNVLTTLARITVGKDGSKRVLQSIGRRDDTRSDAVILRETAAKLWLSGVRVNFDGMHTGAVRRRIPLPTYPFERKRYWVEPVRDSALVAATSAAAAAAPRGAGLDEWVFAPAWTSDDVSLDYPVRLKGSWLVLGDDDELSREVIGRLEECGARAIAVARGADIGAVIADAGQPVGAIHLWGLRGGGSSIEHSYDALVKVGLTLGNALNAPLQFLHVSANAESVSGEQIKQTMGALAMGPVLVLPAESANLKMRAVDLDAVDGLLDVRAAAAALVVEAAHPDATGQSAWRRGRRWSKHFERVSLPPLDDRVPLKQQGVYLITGGLGGMGSTFARWLAATYKARLLLTSRSGERSPAALALMREIETAGGEVIVAAADAADGVAMAAAIDLASQRWGRIDGVIHAAGNSGSGRLTALATAESARATFRPKVAALDVLVSLLGVTPLDFLALMSSINAVYGAPGACDYAAANAVLDAFATGGAYPNAWRHVISFNWDAWRDVGMAVDLVVPASQRELRRAYVEAGVSPQVGIDAFARGLASRRRRLVIETHGVMAAIAASRLTARPGVTESTGAEVGGVQVATREPNAGAGEVASRPALSSEFVAPCSEVEQRLAVIWSELLGVGPIGRQDDFFELGGHSLLATRVLARVQEILGARLELRDVFDAPTLSQLAERIGSGGHSGAAAESEEREEMEF